MRAWDTSWSDHVLGGEVSAEDLQALLDGGHVVQVRARHEVLRADEDRVLFVIRGTAKTHASTWDGGEVITAIVGPGFAGGLDSVLGRSTAGSTLTSLEPLQGLSVDGAELRRLVAERPGLAVACLRDLATLLAATDADRCRFAGTSITQRVARRLTELATRWGRREGSAVQVTLPLTQDELAAWSGASRESVAKVLQRMRATGLVATGRRSLTILDPERLQQRCAWPRPDPLALLLAWPGSHLTGAGAHRAGPAAAAPPGRQPRPSGW
jgi:CRP/FNR family transcriptional regulator, cyclic AMP receptor protein